jgi:hypothetical protein
MLGRMVDQGRSSPGSRSLPFFDRSGSVHADRLKQQGRLFPLFIFEMQKRHDRAGSGAPTAISEARSSMRPFSQCADLRLCTAQVILVILGR